MVDIYQFERFYETLFCFQPVKLINFIYLGKVLRRFLFFFYT